MTVLGTGAGWLESKRKLRAKLAALPIGEKLRLLDALRERSLTLRGGRAISEGATTEAGKRGENPNG